MFVRNALCGATSGFDVETAGTSNGHSSYVPTCFLSLRNHRFHHVSCLKTVHLFLSCFRPCSGETVLIHSTHLPTSPSHRLDLQHFLLCLHAHMFSRHAHTHRIQPMCFPILLSAAVVLRLPAASHFQRYTQTTQPLSQCPSGAVDRRRIREPSLAASHQRLVS